MTLREFEKLLNADRLYEHLGRTVNRELRSRALQVAKHYSSGTWSSGELARMGHPYRRRGPNPLDPSVINVQRGVFRESWHVARAERDGTTLLTVTNDSDVADFMFGTSKMITRPVWERIENDLRQPFVTAILNGVETYWR